MEKSGGRKSRATVPLNGCQLTGWRPIRKRCFQSASVRPASAEPQWCLIWCFPMSSVRRAGIFNWRGGPTSPVLLRREETAETATALTYIIQKEREREIYDPAREGDLGIQHRHCLSSYLCRYAFKQFVWARSYRRFIGNKQGLNSDGQGPKHGVGPMLHKILSYGRAGSNIHVNCVNPPLLHGNWEGTMVPVFSLLWRNEQEGSRGPLSISRDWQSLFS
jgi:hypothetical protein